MVRRRRGGHRRLRNRFGRRRLGEQFRQWFGGGFTHRSSASIASWFGWEATRMRRHGSGCNATAVDCPIARASMVATVWSSRAAWSRRTQVFAVSAEKNSAADSVPAAKARWTGSGRIVAGTAA